uniref:MADS-box domain-containing protein n=1 Tax=Oryza brachyantha TaxID=4533 RepID=J3MJ70_ORYBR
MPRTKLVLELIENEKKRKATYKNRRDGLVQKVSQFSTLCGVDAFLVCFGPGGEVVTTWPPGRPRRDAVPRPPMPPPALAAAPLEFDQSIMSGTAFMDSNPYATTNIVHGGSTATTAVLDDHGQFLAAGAGYDDDLLAHDFAFAAGSGYDLEPRVSTAEVWPMNTLSDPVDGIAFQQQQNDPRELLPGRSSGSNLQDVFQN